MRLLIPKPRKTEDLKSVENSGRFFTEKWVNPNFYNKFNYIDKFPCPRCDGSGIRRTWTGIGSDYEEDSCCCCAGVVNKRIFSELYYYPCLRCHEAVLKSWEKDAEEYRKVKNLIKIRKLTKKDLELLKYWL